MPAWIYKDAVSTDAHTPRLLSDADVIYGLIDELRASDGRVRELEAALKEAIEAVHVFHGPIAWEIYRDNSPEMKRWHAALTTPESKP